MSAIAEGPRIYNLFPLLAGTASAWRDHLDRIAGMGFTWVFLNPFHVTGSSGSLYAVKDYYRLNPAFRGASKKSTDDLLKAFVDAAEMRGIGVMMDLVINHTAQDGLVPEAHPHWFEREADGSLKCPFAVDPADTRKKTVWRDLAEIDFRPRPERQEIVDYFIAVVRYYLNLGFRGFRCDAAYKVPQDVWRAIIDAGRASREDVLFVAENLGAMMEQVEAMRGSHFDFLFNSSKWWDFRSPWLLDQYQQFRSIAPSIAFPETHDTDRLAVDLEADGVRGTEELERRYRQAYLFAATFSTGVMIPVGFEFGFRKRLHVVTTTAADWEEPAFDLTDYIGSVNRMKAAIPVLNEEGPQRHHPLGDGRVAALIRRSNRGPGWAVTLINTDQHAAVSAALWGLDGDIAGGREVTPGRSGPGLTPGMDIALNPGEIRVFTDR